MSSESYAEGLNTGHCRASGPRHLRHYLHTQATIRRGRSLSQLHGKSFSYSLTSYGHSFHQYGFSKFQVSLLISVTNNLNHTLALTASKIRIQARCDPSEDPGELEYDHVVASSAGIGEEGCACFVEAAVCLSVNTRVLRSSGFRFAPRYTLPLVSREWRNGSNSSYNCTPFLHSLLTKGKILGC